MICDEAREAFTDLYDGRLSGPPLTTLSLHLDGCRACRLEWAAFRKAMQALHDLRDEAPSPGFAARVVERIEAPSRWRRAVEALLFPLRLKLPIHAAALVLVGVVGIWVFQRSPELRRAADLGVPAPTERLASPQPSAPLPDKVAAGPKPEAKLGAQPPEPPTKAAHSPVTAPSPPPSAAEKLAVLPPAQEETSMLAAAPPPLARKAEPESAAPRPLRSAPAPAGSGAKAESALQSRAVGPETSKEAASPPAGTADNLFSAAATELATQNYQAAVEDLRAFLAQYPKDERVPDARFFLAEAYRAQHRYAEAGAEFDAFLGQYPDHRRAPVALYRQGETRLDLRDMSGCRILRDALNRYPTAREAASAREILSARCP